MRFLCIAFEHTRRVQKKLQCFGSIVKLYNGFVFLIFFLSNEPNHVLLIISICLLVSSDDNFCKQFGPRSKSDKNAGLYLDRNGCQSDRVVSSNFFALVFVVRLHL